MIQNFVSLIRIRIVIFILDSKYFTLKFYDIFYVTNFNKTNDLSRFSFMTTKDFFQNLRFHVGQIVKVTYELI